MTEITHQRVIDLIAKARWEPSDISDVESALRELLEFRIIKSVGLAQPIVTCISDERLQELIRTQIGKFCPERCVDTEDALRELRLKRAQMPVLIAALLYVKTHSDIREVASNKILTEAKALGILLPP